MFWPSEFMSEVDEPIFGAPRPQHGEQVHDHHYGGDRGRGRGRGRGGGRGRDNRGSRSASRPTRGHYQPRGRR